MNFKATNEQLSPKQLNVILAHLKNTISNFPKLDGLTVSYSYDSENEVISFSWDRGYDKSEDNGYYILDFDSEGRIIGVELLNFKLEGE